jgi:hypothetical protein
MITQTGFLLLPQNSVHTTWASLMSIRLLLRLMWPKNQRGNNDVTHTSNTIPGVSNIFGGKGLQPLLWAESRAARVKFTIKWHTQATELLCREPGVGHPYTIEYFYDRTYSRLWFSWILIIIGTTAQIFAEVPQVDVWRASNGLPADARCRNTGMRATYGATVITVRKACAKSGCKSVVSFLVPYGVVRQVCQPIWDFS